MIHVPSRLEIERAVSRPIDAAKIPELHPSIRWRCLKHLEEARAAKVPFIIVCGYRSPEDQLIEYGKGRKIVGAYPHEWEPAFLDGRGIVTHALPWDSWHQYRLAYDVALLLPDGKHVHWNEVADLDKDGHRDWLEVVEIGESLGLEAGYRWPGKKHDGAHFDFRPGLSLGDAWLMCKDGGRIPDQYFETMVG
jgi:peptidoglycan L-alanyl-D-glutamate endopeptidase CwlK